MSSFDSQREVGKFRKFNLKRKIIEKFFEVRQFSHHFLFNRLENEENPAVESQELETYSTERNCIIDFPSG
jgi:hypothetical protein